MTVGKIKLTYETFIPIKDRYKISESKEVYKHIYKIYDKSTIELKESFYLTLFNRANLFNGFVEISTGSSVGTCVDVKHIITSVCESNSSACIISHNHPSGNLTPSKSDRIITTKIKEALKFVEVQLLDHIIVSPEPSEYYSFADSGEL